MSRGAHDSIEMSVHPSGPRPVTVIGIPSFGMVHMFFVKGYYNLRMPMNTIAKHVYVVGKEVGDARNEIVARALELEAQDPSVRCERVFFIDDDIMLHPDVLLQLLSRQRPIVSGLYYAKTSVPTPLVLHGEFEGTPQTWIPGDLVECYGHGMGICLIAAEVFRRMRDELDLGVDRWGHPRWFQTTRDEAHPILAADGQRRILNETEDMHFLRRARELGYTTAVDTSAQAFGWHLDTKAMTAYPLQQFKEYQEKGTITWQTKHGTVTW